MTTESLSSPEERRARWECAARNAGRPPLDPRTLRFCLAIAGGEIHLNEGYWERQLSAADDRIVQLEARIRELEQQAAAATP